METYDFVVIGSGISGLSFALEASKYGTVAIVTKSEAGHSNTSRAQGGIACVQSSDDSIDNHIKDTLIAGDGLCNKDSVKEIVSLGPESISRLLNWGVEFDVINYFNESRFSLGKEGGHTKRRVLHKKDYTGKSIIDNLLNKINEDKSIYLLENFFAIDLITTNKIISNKVNNRCVGLYVFDQIKEEVISIKSDRIILSTGGSGRVYLYTTNPEVATGDGVAMAWRAGCDISNMEFIQFHPTCLYHHDIKSFLITEAMRGEGAELIDFQGKSFMSNYDPRGSLASRDIVARAIDREIKKTGHPCVFLDITHKKSDFIKFRFPHIYKTCLSVGIDITNDPMPVVPSAHYQCGGVKTNTSGLTSLPGLWAIGEVACTGLHGANRLASNSLLEGVVMSNLALKDILKKMPIVTSSNNIFNIPEWESGNLTDLDERIVIYHNWDEIRRLMWDYVSIVRTTKRLKRASTRLKNLMEEVQEFYWNFSISKDLLELRNLVQVASIIVKSSSLRQESRGLHYTLDFQDKSDQFLKDTIIKKTT